MTNTTEEDEFMNNKREIVQNKFRHSRTRPVKIMATRIALHQKRGMNITACPTYEAELRLVFLGREGSIRPLWLLSRWQECLQTGFHWWFWTQTSSCNISLGIKCSRAPTLVIAKTIVDISGQSNYVFTPQPVYRPTFAGYIPTHL